MWQVIPFIFWPFKKRNIPPAYKDVVEEETVLQRSKSTRKRFMSMKAKEDNDFGGG